MISQKQMKEWIPEAVAGFKAAMPPINAPYPEIRIVTDKTMYAVRDEMLKLTGSLAETVPTDACMETLYGPDGHAILIYQKRFSGSRWERNAKEQFTHFLWHELGHFYVNSTEEPDFVRFLDQRFHEDEEEAQLGYLFWSEFIAEVIACKITPAPAIDWKNFSYYPTRNALYGYLNSAFNGKRNDWWYDLAFFFAKLLADKTTLSFIQAARNGIVKVKRPGSLAEGIGIEREYTFEEAGIDPTAKDPVVPIPLRSHMDELQEQLSAMLSRDCYWIAKIDDLISIGGYLSEIKFGIDYGNEVRLRDRLGLN